jgi:hypothetical protein
MFLGFLGLELVGGREGLRVAKGSNFESRRETCWTVKYVKGNHNWLRISRVLSCCDAFSEVAAKEALYSGLLDLARTDEAVLKALCRGRVPRTDEAVLVAWRRIADPHGVRDPLPVWGAKRPQYRRQYFWIVVFLASWGAILLSIVLKLIQAKTQQEDTVFSTKE